MEKVKKYIKLLLDQALDDGDGDLATSLSTLLDLIEQNLKDK